MTKKFCDKCGAEASDPFLDVFGKIWGASQFKLRAVFELVVDANPSVSTARISTADICRTCQIELIDSLRLKIINSGSKP